MGEYRVNENDEQELPQKIHLELMPKPLSIFFIILMSALVVFQVYSLFQ